MPLRTDSEQLEEPLKVAKDLDLMVSPAQEGDADLMTDLVQRVELPLPHGHHQQPVSGVPRQPHQATSADPTAEYGWTGTRQAAPMHR